MPRQLLTAVSILAGIAGIDRYVEDGTDEEDDMGFCSPTCACGWKCPPCPDWETAIDFLMQHAYEAGILTERQASK